MIVFLNGKFVPEEQAVVSVFDRAFLYGDGLFETIPVRNGVLFRWQQHLDRLHQGAAFLGITPTFDAAKLAHFASTLIQKNQLPNAMLRLTLSRGIGRRGYSPRQADFPTTVMSLHDFPGPEQTLLQNWRLVTSEIRLPAQQRLALFKTANKLPQVLARAEADLQGADEALLSNTEGFLVEGAASNLFWIQRGTVCSPPLDSGILAGVTRQVVLDLCRELGMPVHQRNITGPELAQAEGVFLTLSSAGIVQAVSLDQQPLSRSPLTDRLHRAYWELVIRETTL